MLRLFSHPRRRERDHSSDADMNQAHGLIRRVANTNPSRRAFKWTRDKYLVDTQGPGSETSSTVSDCVTASTLVTTPQLDVKYHLLQSLAQETRQAASPSPSESISVVNQPPALLSADRKFLIPGWNALLNLTPSSFSKRKQLGKLQTKFAVDKTVHDEPIVPLWLNGSPIGHPMVKPTKAPSVLPGYVHEIDNDYLGAELADGPYCDHPLFVHELENTCSAVRSAKFCELEGSTFVPLTSVLRSTDISSLEGHVFEPLSQVVCSSPKSANVDDSEMVSDDQLDTKVHDLIGQNPLPDESTLVSSPMPQLAGECCSSKSDERCMDISAQLTEGDSQHSVPLIRPTSDDDRRQETTLDTTSTLVEALDQTRENAFHVRNLKLVISPRPQSSVRSEVSSPQKSPTTFSITSATVSSAPTSPASPKSIGMSPTAISPVSDIAPHSPSSPASPSELVSPLEDTAMIEQGDMMQRILNEVDRDLLPAILTRFSVIGAARFEARMQEFLCHGAAGIRTHTAGGEDNNGGSKPRRALSTGKSIASKDLGKGRSGKRARDDEDDSGRDDNRGRKQPVRHNPADLVHRKKLACPFHKSNPAMFQLRPDEKRFKTCARGFVNSKDLKEHLKLVHSGPKFFCDRCCKRFKTEREKTAHVKQTQPCQVWHDPEFSSAYIMSKDQQDKVFKKKSSKHTDEQYWHGLWTQLYPEADLPTSIYHEFPELEAMFDQAIDELVPRFVADRAMKLIRPEIDQEDENRYLRKVVSAVREHILDQLDNGNHSWSLAAISSRSSNASQAECETVSRGSPTDCATTTEQIPMQPQNDRIGDWNPQPPPYVLQPIREPDSDNTIEENYDPQSYYPLGFDPPLSSQERRQQTPPPVTSEYDESFQLALDLGHDFANDESALKAFTDWPYEPSLHDNAI